MRLHVALSFILFSLLSGNDSVLVVSTSSSTVVVSSEGTPANALKTLTLTADTLELAEGNTTSLHVKATYKDGSRRTKF
jgi:hypothetical protein